MNPIYIGDTSIGEVPGSGIVYPRGQAARLTRVYEGDADDVPAFVAAHPILSLDYQFSNMALDDVAVDFEGPVARLRLTYYGIPGNFEFTPNDYQSNSRWYVRFAYLKTDNPADGLCILNYYAPTITYKYCLGPPNNPLVDPQYEEYAENPSQITILDSKSLAHQNDTTPYKIQGNFIYNIYAICESFTRDQKASVYDYSETWAVVIQNPDNPPKKLTAGDPGIPAKQ